MNKDKLLSTLLAIAVGAACVPWFAYVATVMWAWFVVPLGVHALGKAHAYGLVSMVALLKTHTQDTDKRSLFEKLAYGVLAPALVLFIGWICHSLM